MTAATSTTPGDSQLRVLELIDQTERLTEALHLDREWLAYVLDAIAVSGLTLVGRGERRPSTWPPIVQDEPCAEVADQMRAAGGAVRSGRRIDIALERADLELIEPATQDELDARTAAYASLALELFPDNVPRPGRPPFTPPPFDPNAPTRTSIRVPITRVPADTSQPAERYTAECRHCDWTSSARRRVDLESETWTHRRERHPDPRPTVASPDPDLDLM